MTPTELRALAEALATTGRPGGICQQAADYLRACADNQPYETERWNVERQSDGSLLVCFNRHERGEKCEYEHFVPAPAAPQAEPKREPLSEKQIDAIHELWYERAGMSFAE